MIIVALTIVGLTTPASAEDAIPAGAKAACENFSVLGATGDAAKLAEGFYSERAMFIGPAPVAGIIIGREAIQKNYAGGFKTFKAISGTCENFVLLNATTVAASGHWMMTPIDPNGRIIKGSYGITVRIRRRPPD
ncbi:YybH family protein [Bradyrhizobium genosp. P]|uniref:YybH family protein n=1 Tax=Bradyrhizobium genosp. P TaxID=83641 RepID=UPI003CF5FC60